MHPVTVVLQAVVGEMLKTPEGALALADALELLNNEDYQPLESSRRDLESLGFYKSGTTLPTSKETGHTLQGLVSFQEIASILAIPLPVQGTEGIYALWDSLDAIRNPPKQPPHTGDLLGRFFGFRLDGVWKPHSQGLAEAIPEVVSFVDLNLVIARP